MQIDIERKMKLLKARVSALVLKPETIGLAETIVKNQRMVSKVLEPLRKEWLNDMLSNPNPGEFRLAASDPDAHFLRWIEARSQHRYHVTRRTVAAVGEKYGSETASKLSSRIHMSDDGDIDCEPMFVSLISPDSSPKLIQPLIGDIY